MGKILLTVLIVIVSFLLLVVVGIGAYVLYLLIRRPLVKFYNQRASESDFCPYDKIPAQLLYFIVQAEDEHFFSHRGIVLDSIQTAFRLNKRAHHIVMGGSTISQQLMKNLYFHFEQRYFRKVVEAILTFHAERVLGKEKILELYLNIIYFGNGQYGIVSAADYYFNKSVDELSTNQQFMLACVPQAPTAANPIKHPDVFFRIREKKLGNFIEKKAISDSDLQIIQSYDAKCLDPDLRPCGEVESRFPDTIVLVNERFGL